MKMNEKIKVGLLPLYIKLYDDYSQSMRPKVDAFHKAISDKLKAAGLDVVDVPVCRVKEEFAAAVAKFEADQAEAIVTLNLAYSPSLESSDVLAATRLPILVLDTTPDYVYDFSTPAEALSYNHGIHGVQDLCNLLRRNHVPFEIFAGHWEKSDVIQRVAYAAKACRIANAMKNARIGIVGDPFAGMGDFAIPYDELKRTIGMEVVKFTGNSFPEITEADLEAEYKKDASTFRVEGVSDELYRKAARVGLGIRRWVDENHFDGFTMNFLSTAAGTPFSAMPFAEATKALADGIGYAGEGDVMTTALVSSLMKVYKETTFCEMFCPDWYGNTIYLNHMGEFNPVCSKGNLRLTAKPFPYTTAGETTAVVGSFKPGRAVFSCLAPQGDGQYAYIITQVEMLDVPDDNGHRDMINGWFRPCMPVPKFLEAYSRLGGIHHASLVYDADIELIKLFGHYMGWNVQVIE